MPGVCHKLNPDLGSLFRKDINSCSFSSSEFDLLDFVYIARFLPVSPIPYSLVPSSILSFLQCCNTSLLSYFSSATSTFSHPWSLLWSYGHGLPGRKSPTPPPYPFAQPLLADVPTPWYAVSGQLDTEGNLKLHHPLAAAFTHRAAMPTVAL